MNKEITLVLVKGKKRYSCQGCYLKIANNYCCYYSERKRSKLYCGEHGVWKIKKDKE